MKMLLPVLWVLILCDLVYADVGIKFQNYGLNDLAFVDKLLFVTSARSLVDCGAQCSRQQACLAFTFNKMTSWSSCRGHSTPLTSLLSSSSASGARSFLREILKPLPGDCQQASQMGLNYTDIQILQASQQYPPFLVTCAQNWTIILRRQNSPVDFYRRWQDYVAGFGDLTGAYWLGLDAMHQMTSQKRYALRVELRDFENVTAYANYSGFSLAPASDFYRLHFDSFLGGSAGDSLLVHNGMRFSTKDIDNDNTTTKHCAQLYQGGWWFRSCFQAHLCGVYQPNGSVSYAQGLQWSRWKGHYYSLAFAQMMIKPME